ncbi:hypothetical protein [Paraburkholderia adhaesiva]|uniref:hypothetical protein n=1 Tax=Paraburkholderia adhaesiva TaxID=2883244 RepID=UPI001F44670C|nr:hypothetical protein [Paraburkholderia adhaesiva]
MMFVQKFAVNADIVTGGAGEAGLTEDVLLRTGDQLVSFKRGVSINLAKGL